MVGIRKRGEEIREFILSNVDHHPKDITAITMTKFQLTRPAVIKHITYLVDQKALIASGTTRNRRYTIHPLTEWEHVYMLDSKLAEDVVWREDIVKTIGEIPDNVLDIWHYSFTEMLNNAIDHSSGSQVTIKLERTASKTKILIFDNGEGIFKKIQRELNLLDERHAVLELAKGKLTTDPEHHTGEGIFFSSRMFDDFSIISGNVYFSHKHEEIEDWILEQKTFGNGTGVFMTLNNNTSRTVKKVFNRFSTDGEYGFTKTVVPVRLTQYGDEKLISRSQAKRLLARIDRFKVVLFDFEGVSVIGQAFADEIFRVFANKNPNISIHFIKANKEVKNMIHRVTKQ